MYVHSNIGQAFDWEILWVCKSLEKAIESASELGDGDLQGPYINYAKDIFLDQLLKDRSGRRAHMIRVKAEVAPYYPAFEMYPKASPVNTFCISTLIARRIIFPRH